MSIQEKNKELMITLDNAWNSQDWDMFNQRHADNVAVFWPGQADPTTGVHNHRQESIEFSKFSQIITSSTIPTRYLLQKETIHAQ